MKPKHKKYILDNIGEKSIEEIARELNLKARKIKRVLEESKVQIAKTAPNIEQTKSPEVKKIVVVGILIALSVLIFAVYANSLGGPFLFDDKVLVESNPLIKDMSNVPVFFKTEIWAHSLDAAPKTNSYRPLQMLTYAVDHMIGSGKAWIFHFSSILFHIINAILVFFIANKLFKNVFISSAIALLFGLHPVNTPCVSYISGRADVIGLMFMLSALIFHINYSNSKNKVFLLGTMLSYLCAIYSKEYAILVVPFILFLYTWVFNKDGIKKILQYAVYVPPLALYFFTRTQALKGLTARVLENASFDMTARVMTSLKTLFIDIRILFFPYGSYTWNLSTS